MLLFEHPHISRPPIALFARKNGQYNRPIISFMTDLRTEDMGVTAIQRERRLMNMIARLPDIPEANQLNKYIVATFGSAKIVDEPKARSLIETGQYLELPSSPESELWSLTERPWWEYALGLDEHGGYIKASLMSREGQFTAETVDERLDEFPENHGKLEVLGPQTIEKMKAGAVKESYTRKLARIKILPK